MKTKKCKDCGKLIQTRSIRCGKCNGKIHSINCSGENAFTYKDGHTLIQHYCKICNKEISCNAKTGKCHSCASLKNGLYSKTNKQYNKCIDCGIEISVHGKRCKSCAGKEKSRTCVHTSNIPICFCKDCKKQLSSSAHYLGTKRCNSCELRRRYKFGLKNFKGRNHPNFGKSPRWKKVKYNKDICMRSTWEVLYAKYLDKNNIKWLYEPKTFDLGNCSYTPDFYLPKTKEYIEIKGWFREKDKKKMKIFKCKYYKEKITVLQQEDLKELGVL